MMVILLFVLMSVMSLTSVCLYHPVTAMLHAAMSQQVIAVLVIKIFLAMAVFVLTHPMVMMMGAMGLLLLMTKMIDPEELKKAQAEMQKQRAGAPSK